MRIGDDGDVVKASPKAKTGGSAHRKSGWTGRLTYRLNGDLHLFDLNVTKITQTHKLEGTTKQGRLSAHFYPKSYAPGDIAVTVVCESQADFQNLAIFVRKHHEALINHVGQFDVNNRKVAQSSSRFAKLLRLQIPSEAIYCRGWIKNFTLTREGFKTPAPEYTFNFTPVYDAHSADFKISQQIVSAYPKKKDETPTPNNRSGTLGV